MVTENGRRKSDSPRDSPWVKIGVVATVFGVVVAIISLAATLHWPPFDATTASPSASREPSPSSSAPPTILPTTLPATLSTSSLSFSAPPRDGESEGRVISVKLTGTIPHGEHLWIFVYHADLYYPQGPGNSLTFTVILGSSLQGDIGSSYTIYAVLVNSQTNSVIQKNLTQWGNYGTAVIPGGSASKKVARRVVFRSH